MTRKLKNMYLIDQPSTSPFKEDPFAPIPSAKPRLNISHGCHNQAHAFGGFSTGGTYNSVRARTLGLRDSVPCSPPSSYSSRERFFLVLGERGRWEAPSGLTSELSRVASLDISEPAINARSRPGGTSPIRGEPPLFPGVNPEESFSGAELRGDVL